MKNALLSLVLLGLIACISNEWGPSGSPPQGIGYLDADGQAHLRRPLSAVLDSVAGRFGKGQIAYVDTSSITITYNPATGIGYLYLCQHYPQDTTAIDSALSPQPPGRDALAARGATLAEHDQRYRRQITAVKVRKHQGSLLFTGQWVSCTAMGEVTCAFTYNALGLIERCRTTERNAQGVCLLRKSIATTPTPLPMTGSSTDILPQP